MNLANRFAQDLADHGLEFTGLTLMPDSDEPDVVTFIAREDDVYDRNYDEPCGCFQCQDYDDSGDVYDPDAEWVALGMRPLTIGQLRAQYWRDVSWFGRGLSGWR